MKQRNLAFAVAVALLLPSCGGKSAKMETVENVIAAAKEADGYEEDYEGLNIYHLNNDKADTKVRLMLEDSNDSPSFQCRISMDFKSAGYIDSVVSTVMFYDSDLSPEGTAYISDGMKNWYISQFHLTSDYGKGNAADGYELLFEDNKYSSTVSTSDVRAISQSVTAVALIALSSFMSSHSLDLKAFLPNF